LKWIVTHTEGVGVVHIWRRSCGDGKVNWLSLQDASNIGHLAFTKYVQLLKIFNYSICIYAHVVVIVPSNVLEVDQLKVSMNVTAFSSHLKCVIFNPTYIFAIAIILELWVE